MSRTTGNIDIDNEILTRLQSENFKSRVEIDYWDGSQWVYEDSVIDTISWSDSVKKRKYLNYGVQPVANTISFTIENRDGRFSPGSGEAEDDRYQIDTKIRIRHIYPLSKDWLLTKDNEWIETKDGNKIYVDQPEYTLYESVFHIDEPVYNVNNTGIDTVKISGRDAYKYALEKDVFLDDLSAGVSIDQLIKDICDQVGILYNASSIADLSSFGDRTLGDGLDDAVKADEVFEDLMSIVNQSGSSGYQMYLDYDDTLADNILFVQPLPSLYEADFAFNENNIMSIGSFKKDRTRFIQRLTCIKSKEVPNEREQLGTANYTTDGEKTLSLSKDSLFRTYTVTINSGTPTVTLDQVNKDSLVFTITNAGDVDITVYGVGYDTYPTISGESIDHDNMVANVGQTAQIESKLFESAEECRKIAEGLITKYGNPDKEVQSLEYPYCNTFLITNDMVFPFIRNIFETDLYYIVGIKHKWSFQGGESTTFNLEDSGLNWLDIYSGFIYDSDYYSMPKQGSLQDYPSTNLPLKYDIGLSYDMTYGPNIKVADIPDNRTYNIDFT